MSETLKKHEEMTRQHHKSCYNKEKFRWEWTTISHLGIWAFGGHNKEKSPHFIDAAFKVPKREAEQVPGWYCYIGPQPEFENS